MNYKDCWHSIKSLAVLVMVFVGIICLILSSVFIMEDMDMTDSKGEERYDSSAEMAEEIGIGEDMVYIVYLIGMMTVVFGMAPRDPMR